MAVTKEEVADLGNHLRIPNLRMPRQVDDDTM